MYRRNINGRKTLPCGTPDTTLPSLLRQKCGMSLAWPTLSLSWPLNVRVLVTILVHQFQILNWWLGMVNDLSFVIFRIFKSVLFFCQLNFIVLFPFILKYYHILFITIVFRLGSDKLVSCFFYCLSQGISHVKWLLAWGRPDDFSFSIIQVHFVFC